jgi:HK97 family phage major capsid protein
MSEFIKGQVSERANAIEQVREILDRAESEARGLSVDDLGHVERLESRIADIDNGIAVARRQEERAAEVAQAAGSFVPAVEASDDNAILRSIAMGEMRGHEFRAALTPTSGSGVVPYDFYNQVFQILQNTNPLFQTSTIINTAGGNTLQVPQVTAYSSNGQFAAGSAISESNPTLSNVNLGAWKFGSLVSLSNEIIADAGVNLLDLVARIGGTQIAYDAGAALTTGTGTTQPTGIVTAAGSGVTGTATSGSPTYENLVDLAYSVAGDQRSRYGFMASTTALAAIRKIKDGAGNYVFTPSISVDGRDFLLGTPIYENASMAAVAATAASKSIVYGKLDDFIVRQAGGIQVATSTDYAFNQDVTTFRITWRGDSNLGATGSVKYFRGGTA